MSARKVPQTVKYDREKLKTILAREGVTKSSLCRELGYGETYLAHKEAREDSHLPLGEFKLICRILNCKEEELIYQEPKAPSYITKDEKIIANIADSAEMMESFRNLASLIQQEMAEAKELCTQTEKMCQQNHSDLVVVRKSLEKISGDNEAAWNKLNGLVTSTVKLKDQVEGLKLDINDSLTDLSDKLAILNPDESELTRKGKLLLTDMLKKGKTEENEIYSEASRYGIQKKYVDRAKQELGIIVISSGYGNNQKKTWQYK